MDHKPARLSAARIRDLLALQSPGARRTFRELRRLILTVAPGADETIAFGCPCYSRPGRFFGVIGGNICLIELPRRRPLIALSFLHGASLPDPRGLLRGSAKSKRYILIPDLAAARRALPLIRAAASRRAE